MLGSPLEKKGMDKYVFSNHIKIKYNGSTYVNNYPINLTTVYKHDMLA